MPAEILTELATVLTADLYAGEMRAEILTDFVKAPIYFLFWTGILHLVARAWRSDRIRPERLWALRVRKFGSYAYLNATFTAPTLIIGSLLGYVPLVGLCSWIILPLYRVALTYNAVKAEYGLSSGKAIVVVLAPLAVLAIFWAAIFAVAGSFI